MPDPAGFANNPFRSAVVTDPWQSGPGDVPEVHNRPFSVCIQALEDVRRDGGNRSVLLHGEAGSGKTHLLRRLRRHWLGEPPYSVDPIRPEVVFVAAKLQTSPQHLWRYVRHSLVEDMLRPVTNDRPSQLQRILLRRLAEIRPADAYLEDWFEWFQQKYPDPDGLRAQLDDLFDELGTRLRLGHDVCSVLIHLLTGRHRRDAKAWLRGESLPEASFNRLGIATPGEDVEPEEDARRMVGALCRLAGAQIPVVFCFDQIEALQIDRSDTAALFAFGRTVMELFQDSENVLIITCCQTSFIQLLQSSMNQPAWERLALKEDTISLLRWDDARRVIQTRLESVPELAGPRSDHPENPLWPLDPEQVKTFVGTRGDTARRILTKCADLLDGIKPGDSVKGNGSGGPRPDPREVLKSEWESRLERASSDSQPVRSGGILAQALPMLVRLKAPGWQSDTGQKPKYIDLLWNGPDGRVGVYLCSERNQTKIVNPLKKLPDLLRLKRLEKLVIVRDARLPVSAPKSRECYQHLIQLGAHELRPNAEALAALDALRSLLSDAKAGDLHHRGEPISPQTVEEWLLANLPEPLDELADSLLRYPSGAGSTDLQNRLVDLLSRSPVLALDDAATALGSASGELEEAVLGLGESVGLLSGPPPVIFRLESELVDA